MQGNSGIETTNENHPKQRVCQQALKPW